MFRPNTEHNIQSLFDTVNQMPGKMRTRLEQSWAEVFYREIFSRIDEHLFEGLYSDKYSRPNTPVNVLVGAELLKAHYGWSDEELFQQCSFNIQVRYALGERDFKGELFSERTLYYFRRALSQHMQGSGENLLEKVFEHLTGEQLQRFAVKTGQQRMDSSFVSSNIRTYSRIQLLVEVIQRFHREMSVEDQREYGERFSAYVEDSSGHYCFRLTSDRAAKTLSALGELMHWVLETMAEPYGETIGYRLIKRVFAEHYKVLAKRISVKPAEELSADSLQSPDDIEATFRRKGDKTYQGYVVNVSETCQDENDVQLITDVTVASNVTDDTEILTARLPKLTEKTDLDTLYTDGGYSSGNNDRLEEKHSITHIQTAIKGRPQKADKLHLEDFIVSPDKVTEKTLITCPGNITVKVRPGRKAERWRGVFPHEACRHCAFASTCCTQDRNRGRVLYFTTSEVRRAQRRRCSRQFMMGGRNPRAGVERTMGLFKHRLRHQKLPVRGLVRVSQYLFATAVMINFSRIATVVMENGLEILKISDIL